MEEALGLFRRLLDEAQTRHDIAAAEYKAASNAYDSSTGALIELGYRISVLDEAERDLHANKYAVEALEAELAKRETPRDVTLVP